jgi:hypothetical protein
MIARRFSTSAAAYRSTARSPTTGRACAYSLFKALELAVGPIEVLCRFRPEFPRHLTWRNSRKYAALGSPGCHDRFLLWKQ